MGSIVTHVRCPYRVRTTCTEPFYCCREHMLQDRLGTQDHFDGFFVVRIDTFTLNDSLRIAMIKDDSGNSGAGVYSLGEIYVAGDSTFQDLTADTDNKVRA